MLVLPRWQLHILVASQDTTALNFANDSVHGAVEDEQNNLSVININQIVGLN